MCTICGGPVLIIQVRPANIVFWSIVAVLVTNNVALGCIAGYVVAAYLSRDMY